jgi:hypothetical protein
MNRQMDVQMNRQTGGRTDGQTDGRRFRIVKKNYQFVFIPLPELEQNGVIGLGGGRRLEVGRRLDGVSDEIGVAGRGVVHGRTGGGDGVARGSGDVGSCKRRLG